MKDEQKNAKNYTYPTAQVVNPTDRVNWYGYVDSMKNNGKLPNAKDYYLAPYNGESKVQMFITEDNWDEFMDILRKYQLKHTNFGLPYDFELFKSYNIKRSELDAYGLKYGIATWNSIKQAHASDPEIILNELEMQHYESIIRKIAENNDEELLHSWLNVDADYLSKPKDENGKEVDKGITEREKEYVAFPFWMVCYGIEGYNFFFMQNIMIDCGIVKGVEQYEHKAHGRELFSRFVKLCRMTLPVCEYGVNIQAYDQQIMDYILLGRDPSKYNEPYFAQNSNTAYNRSILQPEVLKSPLINTKENELIIYRDKSGNYSFKHNDPYIDFYSWKLETSSQLFNHQPIIPLYNHEEGNAMDDAKESKPGQSDVNKSAVGLKTHESNTGEDIVENQGLSFYSKDWRDITANNLKTTLDYNANDVNSTANYTIVRQALGQEAKTASINIFGQGADLFYLKDSSFNALISTVIADYDPKKLAKTGPRKLLAWLKNNLDNPKNIADLGSALFQYTNSLQYGSLILVVSYFDVQRYHNTTANLNNQIAVINEHYQALKHNNPHATWNDFIKIPSEAKLIQTLLNDVWKASKDLKTNQELAATSHIDFDLIEQRYLQKVINHLTGQGSLNNIEHLTLEDVKPLGINYFLQPYMNLYNYYIAKGVVIDATHPMNTTKEDGDSKDVVSWKKAVNEYKQMALLGLVYRCWYWNPAYNYNQEIFAEMKCNPVHRYCDDRSAFPNGIWAYKNTKPLSDIERRNVFNRLIKNDPVIIHDEGDKAPYISLRQDKLTHFLNKNIWGLNQTAFDNEHSSERQIMDLYTKYQHSDNAVLYELHAVTTKSQKQVDTVGQLITSENTNKTTITLQYRKGNKRTRADWVVGYAPSDIEALDDKLFKRVNYKVEMTDVNHASLKHIDRLEYWNKNQYNYLVENYPSIIDWAHQQNPDMDDKSLKACLDYYDHRVIYHRKSGITLEDERRENLYFKWNKQYQALKVKMQELSDQIISYENNPIDDGAIDRQNKILNDAISAAYEENEYEELVQTVYTDLLPTYPDLTDQEVAEVLSCGGTIVDIDLDAWKQRFLNNANLRHGVDNKEQELNDCKIALNELASKIEQVAKRPVFDNAEMWKNEPKESPTFSSIWFDKTQTLKWVYNDKIYQIPFEALSDIKNWDVLEVYEPNKEAFFDKDYGDPIKNRFMNTPTINKEHYYVFRFNYQGAHWPLNGQPIKWHYKTTDAKFDVDGNKISDETKQEFIVSNISRIELFPVKFLQSNRLNEPDEDFYTGIRIFTKDNEDVEEEYECRLDSLHPAALHKQSKYFDEHLDQIEQDDKVKQKPFYHSTLLQAICVPSDAKATNNLPIDQTSHAWDYKKGNNLILKQELHDFYEKDFLGVLEEPSGNLLGDNGYKLLLYNQGRPILVDIKSGGIHSASPVIFKLDSDLYAFDPDESGYYPSMLEALCRNIKTFDKMGLHIVNLLNKLLKVIDKVTRAGIKVNANGISGKINGDDQLQDKQLGRHMLETGQLHNITGFNQVLRKAMNGQLSDDDLIKWNKESANTEELAKHMTDAGKILFQAINVNTDGNLYLTTAKGGEILDGILKEIFETGFNLNSLKDYSLKNGYKLSDTIDIEKWKEARKNSTYIANLWANKIELGGSFKEYWQTGVNTYFGILMECARKKEDVPSDRKSNKALYKVYDALDNKDPNDTPVDVRVKVVKFYISHRDLFPSKYSYDAIRPLVKIKGLLDTWSIILQMEQNEQNYRDALKTDPHAKKQFIITEQYAKFGKFPIVSAAVIERCLFNQNIKDAFKSFKNLLYYASNAKLTSAYDTSKFISVSGEERILERNTRYIIAKSKNKDAVGSLIHTNEYKVKTLNDIENVDTILGLGNKKVQHAIERTALKLQSIIDGISAGVQQALNNPNEDAKLRPYMQQLANLKVDIKLEQVGNGKNPVYFINADWNKVSLFLATYYSKVHKSIKTPLSYSNSKGENVKIPSGDSLLKEMKLTENKVKDQIIPYSTLFSATALHKFFTKIVLKEVDGLGHDHYTFATSLDKNSKFVGSYEATKEADKDGYYYGNYVINEAISNYEVRENGAIYHKNAQGEFINTGVVIDEDYYYYATIKELYKIQKKFLISPNPLPYEDFMTKQEWIDFSEQTEIAPNLGTKVYKDAVNKKMIALTGEKFASHSVYNSTDEDNDEDDEAINEEIVPTANINQENQPTMRKK